MKNKSSLALKYIEGIMYCTILLVSVMLYISGGTYIKMIPIAFIAGIFGQMLLGKKAMTSIFSCILSVVLLQIKTPSLIVQNITESVVITVLTLCGELCGYSLKKLIHLLKLKSTKRREKEKIKHYITCTITLVIALVINSVVNGNLISYLRCKNNLKNYLSEEYSSSSRFKVFSSRYFLEDNARYVFYAKDSLSNDEVGKFIVYLDDTQTIQDEYKEKIYSSVVDSISSSILELENIQDTSITITTENYTDITLNISKSTYEITQESVDEYAKQIATYLQEVAKIEYYDEIEQIKIVFECEKNSKDSLATYVYMDGYKEMLESGQEQDYEYIKRALNIEYVY